MRPFLPAPIAAVLAASLLAACADMPSRAPVDDRSAARAAAARKAAEPAPVADPPGYYTVRKGDTLSRIASQFGQAWRDLVDWNSLSNPNDIKVGQQLRVAPPEGVRLAGVPDAAMEVRPLDSPSSPAEPSPAPSQPQRAAGGLKSGPLGSKLPYSEQALAELQRGDAPGRAPEPARKPAEAASAPAGVPRFIWPSEGRLLSGFDAAKKGIDIAGQMGQPVVAAGDGTVLYAKGMRGYGNLIIVDHGEGIVSAYAHNKTILVREGQTVSRGQQIAEMGNTDADTVKLHFEVRQLGKPVDPTGFLPGR